MTGRRHEYTRLSGYTGLVTAMLYRAVRDARLKSRRADAVRFLASVDAGNWIEALGLDRGLQRDLLHKVGADITPRNHNG